MTVSRTVRLYAQHNFRGDDQGEATASFGVALSALTGEADRVGREVLFDTLMVEVERKTVEAHTLGAGSRVREFAVLCVSAEAVLR